MNIFIFIHNVSLAANDSDVANVIVEALSAPQFSSNRTTFNLVLFPNGLGNGGHNGEGFFAPSNRAAGELFLQLYGGKRPPWILRILNRRIFLREWKNPPRCYSRAMFVPPPRIDHRVVRQQAPDQAAGESEEWQIRSIQFGWECRDQVFSAEYERHCTGSKESCRGMIDTEERQIRIKLFLSTETRVVAFRFSQMHLSAAGVGADGLPYVFFALKTPPAFEIESTPDKLRRVAEAGLRPGRTVYDTCPRTRLTAFDEEHSLNAAYTSLAIRVLCPSENDLQTYRRRCSVAELPEPIFSVHSTQRRHLFSEQALSGYNAWLTKLPWRVAFQVEALTRLWVLDVYEALGLRSAIKSVLRVRGAHYTDHLLRFFALEAKGLWIDQETADDREQETVLDCFNRCRREFVLDAKSLPFDASEDVFECRHLTVTPTSVRPFGPYPEQSNRIIRKYAGNEDRFLRVSFTEEDETLFRHKRGVNWDKFVVERVGGALEGLTVGGRHFEFLAYSQSALKEHTVWFVSSFNGPNGKLVTASTIIADIGSFDKLDFDESLMFIPARYGARVSQAFTATNTSISAHAEEIVRIPDIKAGFRQFTDGVGTISRALAEDIQSALYRRRRHRRPICPPTVFQIRLMGCKGMLSVDYRLSGRAVCIRPSMTKFSAPHSTNIEIVHAVDRPSPFFLNRPLIMLLEGLGVPYEVFQAYQDVAVRETREATSTVGKGAVLLDRHGLGVSFRLASTLADLHKLQILQLDDVFYRQMLVCAIYHVLRELKERARIPVPGGWTLTGVADVHHILEPGEIFACVTCPQCRQRIYLKGPTLITRSPVIHPGDVQVVKAVGAPAPGTPFASEPLANSVVFSVKGDRPLPSYLGGGDLDGDVFNVWGRESRCCCAFPSELAELSLLPKFIEEPADYEPAEKALQRSLSTMVDVGRFFVGYILSDVLGVVATNWLLIADKKTIFDANCLKLAKLHSAAVDYPKSGKPVALRKIPRLGKKAKKPDWYAPETARPSSDVYESQKAIGKLFRSIRLPDIAPDGRSTRRSDGGRMDEHSTLEDLFRTFSLDFTKPVGSDAIEWKIGRRVAMLGVQVEVQGSEHARTALELFRRYAVDLRYLCSTYTLSESRGATLTEEEVVIGTIIARSSSRRKDSKMIASMSDHASHLANGVHAELKGEGQHPTLAKEWLQRAWAAWRTSIVEESFGSKSFWWLALGSVFDAIKEIEGTQYP